MLQTTKWIKILGENPDSRTGAGDMQDELGAFCCSRKQGAIKIEKVTKTTLRGLPLARDGQFEHQNTQWLQLV